MLGCEVIKSVINNTSNKLSDNTLIKIGKSKINSRLNIGSYFLSNQIDTITRSSVADKDKFLTIAKNSDIEKFNKLKKEVDDFFGVTTEEKPEEKTEVEKPEEKEVAISFETNIPKEVEKPAIFNY